MLKWSSDKLLNSENMTSKDICIYLNDLANFKVVRNTSISTVPMKIK